MPKIDLAPDEQLIARGNVHLAVLIPYFIVSVALCLYAYTQEPDFLIPAAAVSVLIILIGLICARHTFIVLTNRRVIGRTGVIMTTDLDAPIRHISFVSIERGILARLFGFGNIRIMTPGGLFSSFNFRGIKAPQLFRAALLREIESFEEQKIRLQASSTAAALYRMQNGDVPVLTVPFAADEPSPVAAEDELAGGQVPPKDSTEQEGHKDQKTIEQPESAGPEPTSTEDAPDRAEDDMYEHAEKQQQPEQLNAAERAEPNQPVEEPSALADAPSAQRDEPSPAGETPPAESPADEPESVTEYRAVVNRAKAALDAMRFDEAALLASQAEARAPEDNETAGADISGERSFLDAFARWYDAPAVRVCGWDFAARPGYRASCGIADGAPVAPMLGIAKNGQYTGVFGGERITADSATLAPEGIYIGEGCVIVFCDAAPENSVIVHSIATGAFDTFHALFAAQRPDAPREFEWESDVTSPDGEAICTYRLRVEYPSSETIAAFR